MRKILLTLLFTLITASIFSSAFDGGYSRMQALGGISYALADRTNNMGIYNAGFASTILLYDAPSAVLLSPTFTSASWGDRYNFLYNLKSFDGMMENANVINIRVSQDDNIVIKPYYYNSNISGKYGLLGNDRVASGEMQYARRLTNEIGAAVTLRYSCMLEESNLLKITSDRFEYLADIYYRVDSELTLTASGGYMGALFEDRAENEMNYSFYGNWDLINYMPLGYSGKLENFMVNVDYKINWINLAAGMQYSKQGVADGYISAGLYMNPALKSTWTMISPPSSNSGTDAASGYFASAGLRVYIPGNIELTASAKGQRFDFSGSDSGSMVPAGVNLAKYTGDFTMGAAYDAGSLKIPVELYMDVFDKYENIEYIQKGGVRGGVEYNINEAVAIRLGADLPYFHNENKGIISDRSWAVTCGVGYTTGAFALNAGARLYYQEQKRSTAYFISDYYYSSIAHLMADVTYLF